VFYDIPGTLCGEIDELDSFFQQHLRGEIDALSLRARRVPFGCYEQREQGKYMLRIRCPGGALTPGQLHTIASLAKEYVGDFIHITTRQEFQIHDLKLEDAVPVMRRLAGVGLATRGGGGNTVRNILVSPEAGVSADEVFDPSPFAFALTSRLVAEPDSWGLPRKFKIAFSNSAKDSAYAQFNDLGFITDIKGGTVGFRVYVAGGMGAKPEIGHLLHEFIPVDDVCLVAEATKRVFDKHGNRRDKHKARLRFLWKQLGEHRFRQLYEQELRQLRREGIRPLELPKHSRTRVVPPFHPVHDHSLEFERWKQRYVVAQRQPGLCSILIPVFLGNLKNEEAVALADFLQAFGNDVLRATLGQNLRLRNIPEDYLGNVYAVVKDISELASAPALLANSIACTGADTCKLGICLSKGALRAIKDKLVGSEFDLDQIADFKLNLSGCPNTCGQHMVADLGFYGKVGHLDEQIFPAYGVVGGGIVGAGEARLARNLGQVSARALPDFVSGVLQTWIQKKSRFHSFAAYIDSEGSHDIALMCQRYGTIPDSGTGSTNFSDWGASAPFSLAGRGQGECSAGSLDLVQLGRPRDKRGPTAPMV
jgi:sulfite reductase (ferredoxin)